MQKKIMIKMTNSKKIKINKKSRKKNLLPLKNPGLNPKL